MAPPNVDRYRVVPFRPRSLDPPMSTRTTRSRVSKLRIRTFAGLGLLLPLACGVNPQPSEYGDDYEDNFMLGCTGLEVETGEPPVGGSVLAPEDECACIYDGLVEKVPFEEAKEFEDEQAKAESGADIEIPDNIASIISDCQTAS